MKKIRPLLALLLLLAGQLAWAAAPGDTLHLNKNSYYQLGKALGQRAGANHDFELLAAIFIIMVVAAPLSSLLRLRTRLPGWRRWLRWLWVPAVLGFVAAAGAGYHSRLLTDGYLLFGYGVLAALLLQLRSYRPAATMLWALVPLVLHRAIEAALHLGGWQLPATYASYFKLWSVLDLPFFSGMIVLAFAQRKAQDRAEAEQAEAERQRQQVAARNAELERLVAERRAALTQQADELQTALRELRATQSQLVQSEKMASLGELTASIAHEIQNPLNFVNNFADVSQELVAELEEEQTHAERDVGLENELLADLKQNLQKISQHGGRASSIVRGMLAHSRQNTGEQELTDLSVLADEYLRLAYHGLRAKDKSFNATLETDFAPVLPLVAAVPGDLGRVLLNLLTNAFYAVQQRQRQGEPGYAPTVRVSTARQGDEVEVRVRDNGTGIPEAVRAKIFQPFFTTKPTGEGTGLGLSLAHDIVTKGHGGILAVESQEGAFTEFILRLPFRAREATLPPNHHLAG